MYQILIADDESSVIESLVEAIDWKTLGAQEPVCVSGGMEALNYIKNNEVDIAILDIRMPGVSGLEVCEQIKRINENIQLILISGYAEFSYAEKAIHYGVLGYCLKPLEYDKIMKLLLKAIHQIEQTKRRLSDSDFLDALNNNQIEVIRDLLSERGIGKDRCYLAVLNGAEHPLRNMMAITIGRGQYCLISEAVLTEEQLSELLLSEKAKSIGYLKEPVTIEQIPQSLQRCLVQSYQYFIDSSCTICENLSEEKTEQYIWRLAESISKNAWDNVCEQLTMIEKGPYEDFSVQTALRMSNMIFASELFREEVNDYYLYSIGQMVREYDDFEHLLRSLKELILGAEKYEEKDAFSNSAFMKLMHYVDTHYQGDISLTSAAQELHLNPNYISQLFKKESGITFVHYITQKRIKQASELLVTTNKPISEIADEVGFHDYFYFSKIFKKTMLKTPGQYRNEM